MQRFLNFVYYNIFVLFLFSQHVRTVNARKCFVIIPQCVSIYIRTDHAYTYALNAVKRLWKAQNWNVINWCILAKNHFNVRSTVAENVSRWTLTYERTSEYIQVIDRTYVRSMAVIKNSHSLPTLNRIYWHTLKQSK